MYSISNQRLMAVLLGSFNYLDTGTRPSTSLHEPNGLWLMPVMILGQGDGSPTVDSP